MEISALEDQKSKIQIKSEKVTPALICKYLNLLVIKTYENSMRMKLLDQQKVIDQNQMLD